VKNARELACERELDQSRASHNKPLSRRKLPAGESVWPEVKHKTLPSVKSTDTRVTFPVSLCTFALAPDLVL